MSTVKLNKTRRVPSLRLRVAALKVRMTALVRVVKKEKQWIWD